MLSTKICELFGIQTPIVNAPMAGIALGELAAAVSEAGGLGLIGAMGNTPDSLREQIRLARERTGRPLGVGFITHWLPEAADLYEVALKERVAVIAHSFVDPAPYVPAAKDAGAKIICQVQTVGGALRALEAGVDAIVAQGTEAGAHTGPIPVAVLLPQVVAAVSPLPVIAAGGIADGRGAAAAFMLGAEGVWMGTAFLASPESGYPPVRKRRILEMCASDTIRTRVFDIAMGDPWPEYIAGRAGRNAFSDRWHGREEELKGSREAAALMEAAMKNEDISIRPVWAGEGVGLVTTTKSAGDVVHDISAEADRILRDRRF